MKELIKSTEDRTAVEFIKNEESISPFRTVNRIMGYLLAKGGLSYDDYTKLSEEYVKRHQQQNPYLYLFDMAPRTFG